jgi:hypothetical protein
MAARKCQACGRFFEPRPQTPFQLYCSRPECQKERRRLSKQGARRADPGGPPGNQRSSTDRNPHYWKLYRAEHPEYVERNRILQRARNRTRRLTEARVETAGVLPPGRYLLTPVDDTGVATGHAYLVEINVLWGFPGNG